MDDDFFRCRCVVRVQFEHLDMELSPAPCDERATQEDGLCDNCREHDCQALADEEHKKVGDFLARLGAPVELPDRGV